MRKRALLAALVAMLTIAGTAAGDDARRVFTIRAGDGAVFAGRSGGWLCNNAGRFVECFSGDAKPYVRLTTSGAGGITVKVYTLGRLEGRLTRTYERGQPVYIFSASP